jgi:hypothetical protein
VAAAAVRAVTGRSLLAHWEELDPEVLKWAAVFIN